MNLTLQDCRLVPAAAGWTCRECGVPVSPGLQAAVDRAGGNIASLKRNCKIPRFPCAHIGDEVRLQECETCGVVGKTKIKVFACAIHRECSIRELPGIACCALGHCEDYTPLLL